MLRQPVKEIHFHAPGLRRFETSEYGQQDAARFVSVSVTGSACALSCDHCNMKVLQGMIPLPMHQAGLYELCAEMHGAGARGVLISGGCDKGGRVPLRAHLHDLGRVRRELGMTVRVHTGLLDEETAAGLGEAGIDGAMIDIIGADATIRDVYHLESTVADYEAALALLERHRVPAVPHIILGLHYGRFLGEYAALEMVARHARSLLVLVILQPLYGTAMHEGPPPDPAAVGAFFRAARARLGDAPIMLGCARPLGPVKAEYDRHAVDAGLDGIAYPAEGIIAYAREQGRVPRFHDACCGVQW